MPESEAFLKAICDNPDDDGPRLIYADWLEENGDPERAEFIRVQCALEGMKEDDPQWKSLCERERELLKAHWVEWITPICEACRAPLPEKLIPRPFWHPSRWLLNPLKSDPHKYAVRYLEKMTLEYAPPFRLAHDPDRPRSYYIFSLLHRYSSSPTVRFNRGFIDSLMFLFDRENLFEFMDQCLSITPLTTLLLDDKGFGTIQGLIQQDRFLQLRSLNLHWMQPETFHAILQSPKMVRLRKLSLTNTHYRDYSVPLNAVTRCSHLHQLRELSLGRFLLSEDDLRELLNSPLIEQLQKLSLCYSELSDDAAIIFVESTRFRESKCTLDLCRMNIRSEVCSRLKSVLGDRFRNNADYAQ